MKNYFIFLICCLLFSLKTIAQSDSLKIDSLKKVLLTEKEDTNKVNTLHELSFYFFDQRGNNAFKQVNEEELALAVKLNFELGEGNAYHTRANYFITTEVNSAEAIKSYYEAIKHYEKCNNQEGIAKIYSEIAVINSDLNNNEEALKNLFLSLKIYKSVSDSINIAFGLTSIGYTYSLGNKYKEAAAYLNEAQKFYNALGNERFPVQVIANYESTGILYNKEGLAALASGNTEEADKLFMQSLQNYQTSLKIGEKIKSKFTIGETSIYLGELYTDMKDYAKAKDALTKGLQLTEQFGNFDNLPDGYRSLAAADSAQGNYKQAYTNYKTYIKYHDSLFNLNAQKKTLQISMQYDFDKKESIAKVEQDKKDADTKRSKNQQYLVIASLGILVLAVLIIALIQLRSNKQKQKANLLLERQKLKVESTLTELKSTQAQLIQSEKMASLGELTAGIAHGIQNPLNFVNNFSEVNTELIDELEQEADKGNISEVKSIAKDIRENEEKINHHGKRADAIVKGMLQHSRSSTGQKELTDINALADEYLRLAYHGLRAKDNSFNVTMKTDFDNSIGKINIIPQDIGRVLLNLYNNAFYAVNEKIKTNAENYQPIVSVQTKRLNDKIILTVMDNGNGIPQKVIDKIFQPFFTTKPTGQGTGLGLSLSYDIIKAHGGEIKVNTKEGEGSEFIIRLPM